MGTGRRGGYAVLCPPSGYTAGVNTAMVTTAGVTTAMVTTAGVTTAMVTTVGDCTLARSPTVH